MSASFGHVSIGKDSQLILGDAGNEASAATTSRVELELSDLCLQADIFDEASPYTRRVAFSVRSFELRDCALRADAPPAWKQIFGQSVSATTPRGTTACILSVRLSSSLTLLHTCIRTEGTIHKAKGRSAFRQCFQLPRTGRLPDTWSPYIGQVGTDKADSVHCELSPVAFKS